VEGRRRGAGGFVDAIQEGDTFETTAGRRLRTRVAREQVAEASKRQRGKGRRKFRWSSSIMGVGRGVEVEFYVGSGPGNTVPHGNATSLATTQASGTPVMNNHGWISALLSLLCIIFVDVMVGEEQTDNALRTLSIWLDLDLLQTSLTCLRLAKCGQRRGQDKSIPFQQFTAEHV
jgi:hypothetical protein